MLRMIEGAAAKAAAHKRLVASITNAWPAREKRIVTWRPGSKELWVHHNHCYWFGSLPPSQADPTPRFWDLHGEYRKSGNLQIAVELNVAAQSNARKVSGFFAIDPQSGAIYFMHDGGVGGGREGVGQRAFLAWSSPRLVPVVDSAGRARHAIIVARVGSRTTAEEVCRFVQLVVDFKKAVKREETTTPLARAAARSYRDYYDEFSGNKRRPAAEGLEYASRHGDIVRALCEWRHRRKNANAKIVKNAYIDLGIQEAGQLAELYEVKPSCERQSLYTAIGQILVHSGTACLRFIVLPANGKIPNDIHEALSRARISLLRFQLIHGRVRILA
ncbi:MAG: hypothetical protein ACRD1C_12045 [Terriglobales bacterium]